ncbi:class I SAM-dependent methyltransferase [uncultured Mycolicibacterium sp.]|uniref:class I SAM-dependent methyltransferase n=1 Tax=uncultured Mycolicibacterium sp. TaxID=2320817 RepID=UPI0032B1232F
MYAQAADPWQLQHRWYERRKYAITTAMLPYERYRSAFEPGCSVGVLTEQLAGRCDHVVSTDVSVAALDATRARLVTAGLRDRVRLMRGSLDQPWPPGPFDLVMLSEVCYYLQPETLRAVLDHEVPRLSAAATVVAAHWRHRVEEYPMSGDRANEIIAATAGLHHLGRYQDADVVIDVFDRSGAASVAARTSVPGA